MQQQNDFNGRTCLGSAGEISQTERDHPESFCQYENVITKRKKNPQNLPLCIVLLPWQQLYLFLE